MKLSRRLANNIADVCDAKRTQLFVGFADRDIFARLEDMVVESIPDLVVDIDVAGLLIMEGPSAAGPAQETAMLMFRTSPEAQNTALVAAVMPLACIDSSACIQRSDEFISVLAAAGGKFLIAGK